MSEVATVLQVCWLTILLKILRCMTLGITGNLFSLERQNNHAYALLAVRIKLWHSG